MRFRPARDRSPVLAGFILSLALALLVLSGAPARADAPRPKVTHLKVAKPERILFIGNSYLYYNDSLHNHVRRLVEAAGLYKLSQMHYKSVTIGGGKLMDHDIDSYLTPGKLRVKGPFQVVVMQGFSAAALSKKNAEDFEKTVVADAKKIRAAGGEPALYMTQAYTKWHKKKFPADMVQKVEKLYVETGNKIGALVIPVGLAFAEAYKERPDLPLQQTYDGSHPKLIGTYLAACVVLESLYGISPVGNSYTYFGKVDKDMAAFLQQVAHKTVTAFYGRH